MEPQTTTIDTSRLTGKQETDAGPNLPAVAPPVKPALEKPLNLEEIQKLKDDIIAALCTCFDPEIPVNIYELGLIYDITIAPTGEVGISMTLTSPGCPVAGTLPGDVQRKVQPLPNITAVKVDVVWDPPWNKDRMSEAAKLQLGIDD
jgi:FeS assembly SUF system protein